MDYLAICKKIKLLFLTISILIIAIFNSNCTNGDPFYGHYGSNILGVICVISFCMAILGGLVAIFHPKSDSKVASGWVGVVFLIASLIILA